ncbi:MAG: M20/M25/M40 family metallo-hydrolase [Candidatus Calescibacterium sp.]|nr:M20/M25/M40 family metallo-hydrolase [Candidatus Calescibacterium sp.]MDW8132715.1 M20/M25/M40 family metallo-hydrolase [Candidatus Calescibacterium sp.]
MKKKFISVVNVVDIIVNLLKIRSVTGCEDNLRKYIIDFIKDKLNFQVIRNNVVAYPKNDKGSYPIAFVGHIDTVNNANDKDGIMEGDRIFGLGASDMKAGIAVMLSLINKFSDLPLLWIFYDREEGKYDDNGLNLVFQNFGDLLMKANFAIILEPTSNNIEMGCNGVINYGIWIRGKSGHSARRNTYQNPFYLSIPVIKYLESYEPEVYKRVIMFSNKSYELSFVSNAVITQIKGLKDLYTENDFRNVVPEYCFLNVNVRYTPNHEFANFNEDFKKGLEKYSIFKLDVIDYAPAGKIIMNKSLEHFIDWYLDNGEFGVFAKQAWTDVARFTLHGIPAINLGPGEPTQAHQVNEYSYISKMEQLELILNKYLVSLRI